MANPKWADASVPKHLPDRVAQWYYSTGVLCSSHPYSIIAASIIIIFLCSCPLLYLSFPGNVPLSCTTPKLQFDISSPRWLLENPKLYIQQVVLRSIVDPWDEGLLLTDAFRAPIAESFKLVDLVRNYQANGSVSLGNFCLNIDGVKKSSNKMTAVLPEFNCLILSPGNLWMQDYSKFQRDANLINTIYSYQGIAKGKTSISEMLFGLPLPNTGIKRYPLRKKQRPIQFAITIFMNEYIDVYIDGLKNHLHKFYPASSSFEAISNNNSQSFIHVYYPEDVNYGESLPLSITYLMIFFFVYFYFRKIQHIKNRILMASIVVITIATSLSTTLGICSFFGLEYNGSKETFKKVFLYLITVVGLENVLVLVLSVVTTTSHLDVKIRIAQGLSKEGWNITKHFLVIITILTAGLLTFVPAIQEFCIFFIVALLTNLFLQIIFFLTALSLNIECTEQVTNQLHESYVLNMPSRNFEESHRLLRSHSHPRLSGQSLSVPFRQNRAMPSNGIAKRVKVVHFWARTRFVQRSFMVFMSIWISIIVYNADTIQTFIQATTSSEVDDLSIVQDITKQPPIVWQPTFNPRFENGTTDARYQEFKKFNPTKVNGTSDIGWMKRVDYDTRRSLSLRHWSSILSLYNISLSGSYVTLLPTIELVHIIPPEVAQSLRNPQEVGIKFMWQSLAMALDPIDIPDGENGEGSTRFNGETRVRPFIPSSPLEILMAALLAITSFIVLVYFFIVLYKCVCTRNYAEWRASWTRSKEVSFQRSHVLMDAIIIELPGHDHMIDSICARRDVIISSCLGGRVKIWNSINGSFKFNLNRKIAVRNDQLTGFRLRKNEPVWSIDCYDNIIVLGCSDGGIEVWDNHTGHLKCSELEDVGVTAVKIVNSVVVVARLDGAICFYRLEIFNTDPSVDILNSSTVYPRGHGRTVSDGSLRWDGGTIETWTCSKIEQCSSAHTKPISVLLSGGGRIITGSEDTFLKVFDLENRTRPYALGRHNGPITCAFFDQSYQACIGSGSQDGSLCVWDFRSRLCIFRVNAHDGTIFDLTYSVSYVISLGLDERLCVWDRFQGHLLNTILLSDSYCQSICMLTHNLLVTSKQDFLVVLDVGTGEIIHQVTLCKPRSSCTFIKQILRVNDGIVCDFGRQIKLIRFPLIYDKSD